MLRQFLLGSDPRQQIRVRHSLLALGVYLVCAGIQHAEVLLGMLDPGQSARLTAWNLTGGTLFYLLVRSGLNLRLPGIADTSLTMPQTLWGMAGISASYGIHGEARGAVIVLMLLVLIFGVFNLNARRSRLLVVTGFAMLGSVMVFKAVTDPGDNDPRVEMLHLLFAGVAMAAVSALAISVGRLRERLQGQRGELAAALERIRTLATQDELTGLMNRRAVQEHLRAELSSDAARMALAILDIDNFKQVNDRHGHAAGDEVLRRFADCSRTVLHGGDVLARWGGEEFLLVMPGTDRMQALQRIAALRQRLGCECFAELAPGFVLRFSAGVAECSHLAQLQDAINRADAAMYAAKHAGRDRTAVDPPEHAGLQACLGACP